MLFWEGVCQFIHGKQSTSMVFAGEALQFSNGAVMGVERDIPSKNRDWPSPLLPSDMHALGRVWKLFCFSLCENCDVWMDVWIAR